MSPGQPLASTTMVGVGHIGAPPARPTRLIVLDCDGVLIDSERIACGVVADALRRLGLHTSVDDILQRYTGVSAAALYADVQARTGLVVAAAQRQAIGNAVEAALGERVQAMPGVAVVLADLARSHRLCVASSSAPGRLALCLARTGLARFFGGQVYSAQQVAHGKPAPDLFLFAAAQLQVDPAHCLVVEDSPAGVQAAVAAGMRCFGFVGGSHATPALAAALQTHGALAVFDAMAQLPALLRGGGR